jgi:hypothetical protein
MIALGLTALHIMSMKCYMLVVTGNSVNVQNVSRTSMQVPTFEV